MVDFATGAMVCGAAFGSVMLLGLQSKLMRDDRWKLSFFTSWMITVAQTATMYAAAHSSLTQAEFIFFSGWGGSTGIVSAHFVYSWLENKRGKRGPDKTADSSRGAVHCSGCSRCAEPVAAGPS